MTDENETLRWPTNLDRAGIVERLVQVRGMAVEAGLTDIAGRFAGVETMPAAEITATRPSRSTLACGAVIFFSAAMDFSALNSW